MMRERNKYGVLLDRAGREARTADGILFASQREKDRYLELRMLLRCGEITDLVLQERFALVVTGVETVRIGEYRADFSYTDKAGARVREDAKGVRTANFIMKKKLVRACHGIDIREV